MLAHIALVHTVFLIGVAGLLVSAAWAAVAARRAGERAGLLGIAFAGALLQAAGQTWDLIEHTRLTHGGPVAWALIVIGPLIAVAALAGRMRRERAGALRDRKRMSAVGR